MSTRKNREWTSEENKAIRAVRASSFLMLGAMRRGDAKVEILYTNMLSCSLIAFRALIRSSNSQSIKIKNE